MLDRFVSRSYLAVLLIVSSLTSCDDQPITATYHGGIRALVEANCVVCHKEGGIGPFSLDDPDTVQLLASSLVDEVEARRMPPWGMNPDCREVTDSIRLSDREVAAFAQWRDAGFPAGQPDDYRPPDPDDVLTTGTVESQLGPADLVLAPDQPYTPDTARPDDYRCIPLPHSIDRDLFVNAVDVIPDKLDLVHHVIVYAVPEADVPAMEALDAADPGPGFNCFGDAGVASADAVGGWVPGDNNGGASREIAMRVSRGSRLVTQMHYNVAGRQNDDLPGDATSVALWFLEEGQYPAYLITSLWIPNNDLFIPAGDKNSVQMATMRLPVDGYAVAVSPHMHLLGKRIKTEVIRENGAIECLGQVDDWDFNWQRTYEFPEHAFVPIDISDRIRLTCEYDNSPANQPVVNGEQKEPRDVTWGEGTLDEMCLDSLIVLTPFRGRGETGVCAGFRDCFDDCGKGRPFCALACMTAASSACLNCGTQGLFGSCATDTCPTERQSIDRCLATCPGGDSDYFECLYSACRNQFQSYYDCVEPTLRSGSCAGDFANCQGVTP
ncbi:MAG: hypothetical protein MJE77_05760 [Proteobacteria bacterium]|nr:hypothetical protein [Pseudomonadota bacterium]